MVFFKLGNCENVDHRTGKLSGFVSVDTMVSNKKTVS